MLTAMTEEDWTIVLRVFAACGRGAATRARTTEIFSKLCTILWFIISLGGLFRRNSGTGTACGSGSGG
jgi:hypothetical protein